MKKTSLLIAVFFFFSISMLNAQFNQGKILLGVSITSDLSSLMSMYSNGSQNIINLGFSTFKYKSDSEEDDSEKLRNFNISPRVGYFLVNNLAAGFNVNFSIAALGTGDDKDTETLLEFGPFVRYYLPGEKIAPFFELGGSIGSRKEKYINWNEEEVTYKQSISSFYGGIGLAVPLGEKISFDIMGGYFSSTTKDKEDNPDNSRLIFNTLGIEIGFIIIIGPNE